ncbi:uncharacterized protein LOC130893957 [Diorhabda carinulata]|uniref:uncharacterized protein LOC130893957 n=1 Tax=Diorhabda carinulata TaxID=1163345 RepID=UPI0025A24F69|nr:uncharacterized protein LOC130893957 [Diorhabda carinulata]
MFKGFLLICLSVVFVESHPTMYRMNDNNALEPVLVPISSTVIPLPVYKLTYGIEAGSPNHKIKKPEGPIYLETVHTKKKPIPFTKSKPSTSPSSTKVA